MKKTLFFLLLLFSFSSGIAQNAADVETSFGPIPGFNGIIKATAQQPDGKILVGGSFTTYKGATCNYFTRLLPNGNVDTAFTFETTFWYGVTSILVQPDGKILVGGGFHTPPNGPKVGIIRLNSDGTTDDSFNTIEKFQGISLVYDMVFQPDGKIILVGSFSAYDAVSRPGIARINTDGGLDTTFDPGTGFGSANSIALQSDGKMIVVGNFTNYNGYTRNRIIRLNPDASVDLTFSIGVGFDGYGVKSVLIQPDGKIVAAGLFYNYKNASQNGIIRLMANGDKDTSFAIGTGFTYLSSYYNPNAVDISDMAIDNSGNIIVGGAISSYNGIEKYNCVRLSPNGSLDNSFSIVNSSFIYSVLILSDQKIILGGNNYISKFNSNATFDYTFDYGSGFNSPSGYPEESVIQPNGQIIVGGYFSLYKLRRELGLIRLNADGSKDTAFDVSYLDMCQTKKILLQPDGKIIALGTFHYLGGSTYFGSIRLNANGSQDMTFSTTGASANDDGLALQADGKILVCGGFQVRRLNTNGTADNTFNTGSGFNSNVRSVAVQPDGKIIVVGDFTLFNGEQHHGIVRLLPNGNIDTSFNTGEGFDSTASTICIQSDGKILVGGRFSSYNIALVWGIIRINTDGSLDTTFNAGYNINNVNSIIVQSDGKIVVGGWKTYFVGSYFTNLIRFNADGSVDSTFDIGTGFDEGDNNSYVSKLNLQPDGKILVSGNFKNYKSVGSNNLVRLYGGNSVLSNENFTNDNIVLHPNPTRDYINLNLPDNLGAFDYEVVDLTGKKLFENKNSEITIIDVQSLSTGIYLIKIKAEGREYSTKFVKE